MLPRVNRHTGGLENLIKLDLEAGVVNRHTGGLERLRGQAVRRLVC